MRLAVMQSPSPFGDIEAACATVETALRAAGAAGADVLTVPEVFLPGYNQDDIAALALDLGAAPLLRLAEAARQAGCALVLGLAERQGDRVLNTAICIDADGKTTAVYRKIQLYGPREKAIYVPGDAYAIFALGGQKAAMLICFDIEFAPHIRALADQGVTLILCPTANMMPFTHVPRHSVAAMAASHGVAIAYANYCGTEGDLTYTGGSLIAGPHGEVLAQAGEGPALLIADLPERDPARLVDLTAEFRVI